MHPAAALWRHARAVAAADAAACAAAPSARALLAARLPAPAARRCYATGADDGVQTVFHTAKKQAQRSAAARRPDARDFDYLRDEVATRLVDRLHDITRSFPVALDLGANTGNVGRQLELTGAGGVQRLYAVEQNRACGRRAAGGVARVGRGGCWGRRGAADGAGVAGRRRLVRTSPGGRGWCGRRRVPSAVGRRARAELTGRLVIRRWCGAALHVDGTLPAHARAQGASDSAVQPQSQHPPPARPGHPRPAGDMLFRDCDAWRSYRNGACGWR